MKRTLGWFILIPLLLMIIFVAGYIGTCTYYNVKWNSGTTFNTPEPDEARYSFRVMNTGNTLYANGYDKTISDRGDEVYTIDGYYWVLDGSTVEFKRYKGKVVLDEGIFGNIRVTDRGRQN